MIELNWTEFKDIVSRNFLAPQYAEGSTRYLLFASDGAIVYSCVLDKNPSDTTDIDDFEANMKPTANDQVVRKNSNGRPMQHQTSRDFGFTTYFTGAGDVTSDPTLVGGAGAHMTWMHNVGDPVQQVIYCDFNTIVNDTHVHEGYLQWSGAINDCVTAEIVPKVTAFTASASTNYNLFGGYLIIPAAGDGTIQVDTAELQNLVQVPTNLDTGEYLGAGFWDADFDLATKTFINITPNPLGTGEFNLFGAEVPLNRFGNKVTVLGVGFMNLQTSDKSDLGHGNRFRITVNTEGADHAWLGNFNLVLHRKKTI